MRNNASIWAYSNTSHFMSSKNIKYLLNDIYDEASSMITLIMHKLIEQLVMKY